MTKLQNMPIKGEFMDGSTTIQYPGREYKTHYSTEFLPDTYSELVLNVKNFCDKYGYDIEKIGFGVQREGGVYVYNNIPAEIKNDQP